MVVAYRGSKIAGEKVCSYNRSDKLNESKSVRKENARLTSYPDNRTKLRTIPGFIYLFFLMRATQYI